MKQSLITPTLTLLIGIGIGVAVGHSVVTSTKQGEPGDGQSSAVPVGPRAAMDRGRYARSVSASGTRSHHDRNAVATIRRVSKQFEMSSAMNMNYQALLLEAYEAVRGMGPEDLQMALDELNSGGGVNQSTIRLRSMLMGLWAKEDGWGAMKYATSLKQPMDKRMSVTSVLIGWMKHDHGNAYQWYKDNREELGGGGMIGGLQLDSIFVATLAQQDMDMAFRELGELNGQNKSITLTMMAANMAMDVAKRQKFIEQLEKLEDEQLKQTGMSYFIGSWAKSDPQGAVGYLEMMDPKPDNHQALMDSVASNWCLVDPEGAIQWQLKNVGEGEVAGDKIARTFGQWAANDPDAAAKWLAKQPEGFATDDLYASAAGASAAGVSAWMKPEAATKWAVKIEDETIRKQNLRVIHSSLLSEGEEAVKKWMDGLDPSIREEVESFEEYQSVPLPLAHANENNEITE